MKGGHKGEKVKELLLMEGDQMQQWYQPEWVWKWSGKPERLQRPSSAQWVKLYCINVQFLACVKGTVVIKEMTQCLEVCVRHLGINAYTNANKYTLCVHTCGG